ncbi:MAG: efflux RND transporter periplasmic adaptor subunit [Longimicrobiales bacterium]
MIRSKQGLVSFGLVAAAVALVGFRIAGGESGPAAQEAEGHDHAAMTAGAAGERQPVRLSAEDGRRIGVAMTTVQRRVLPVSVSTVGVVAYDETGLATVNPKVTGWVERLHVEFTGARVRAGQPLLDLYSPALVAAQEELILAARLVREAGSGRAADNAAELLESARRRLSYWDVPAEEIQAIEASTAPRKTVTLYAPASGVVVEKNVVEGDRILPGMTVYRIADLSSVWIEAEVFEKDLGLVREGQAADVTFEAFPGRTFPGRVAYVYPTVSMQSRTGRVRLELANPGGELRPGMYARVRLDAPAAPETLVVPRSAVLSTGRRTLVFMAAPDGTLVPQEVVTGRAADDLIEILEGVDAGARVASSAAFLIDAESSLGTLAGPMDGQVGMDEMAGEAAPVEEVDHSGHDMGAAAPDTVDHSAHS